MENMCLSSGEQYQQCNMSLEGNDNLHEALWKVCAGPSVDLPRLGEHVYYFPQGHLEQLVESSKVDLDQNISLHDPPPPSKIFCKVINIQLLAEEETDEVYAQITLLPQKNVPEPKSPQQLPDPPKPGFNSFSKVLAASDTNGHCRLHIRKKDAENCLPPLGTTEQIPTQELPAKDLYGIQWRFKHVLKGCPPRHLFTGGWSKFVTSKRLVPGDSFVFLRGENGEFRVGVRRLTLQPITKQSPAIPSENIVQVLATASYAMATGGLFSVHYRPRKSQFIVGLNKYLQAVKHNFSIGMRFKMQVKGEDCIERKCMGTIIGIEDVAPQWKNCAWRTLKVQWDNSTCSKGPERVSSWEIEPLVPPIAKCLVQMGGKKQQEISSSPVLKRKRAIVEVQQEHMELGAMVKEPTQPPVVSSEVVGERLHDIPITVPMEVYEILNPEEGVQELNSVAAYHDNDPATYGAKQVSCSYFNTQLTSVHPSSNQFPTEVDIGGRKQLEGINISDTSHAVLSSFSQASEGSDTLFLSILGDVQEQVEWQRETPPPRQQSLLTDHLVLHQETSSTGLESSPAVMHISSIPSQIPFSGPSNANEMINWEGYLVAQHCIPILDRIMKRYPNTLSSFQLQSHTFQSMSLEMLAKVVVMLQNLTVENMDEEQLHTFKCHVKDLKINGIEMEWLERRLEHIVLARRREELARKVNEASAIMRQWERDLISVEMQLAEVSSNIGAEPLSANHSVMQGLL